MLQCYIILKYGLLLTLTDSDTKQCRQCFQVKAISSDYTWCCGTIIVQCSVFFGLLLLISSVKVRECQQNPIMVITWLIDTAQCTCSAMMKLSGCCYTAVMFYCWLLYIPIPGVWCVIILIHWLTVTAVVVRNFSQRLAGYSGLLCFR